MQVRQIWPWIAANHKKATRKPYEKTGAFKLGWKFSTRFAKVSPKVLLLAGLAVSDGIQDDSLDRAERRVFFELHMAQHAQDNHDPGAEAALVKSWSDLIADKQRQPWEIFQAAFSGCSVGQLPGWARKTAASKCAVQLPQVRLLSLFKHFGELPVASAIVEFAGEDVPQTFRQNLRLLQARGDAVNQAKHCAVVKLLTEMENAGHERGVLYRAAYRMHHLWKKVQGAFPAFARPPKGPDSIRVPRSYQRALPEFERLVSELQYANRLRDRWQKRQGWQPDEWENPPADWQPPSRVRAGTEAEDNEKRIAEKEAEHGVTDDAEHDAADGEDEGDEFGDEAFEGAEIVAG